MNKLLLFLLPILFGCNTSQKRADGEWKTIVVGAYEFDFPPDFKLIPEEGIDSYVGRVEGDSIRFGFDYGVYTNKLTQTPDEYLEDGEWKYHILPYLHLKSGVTYHQNDIPKVEVLSVTPLTETDSLYCKGCEYLVKYKIDSTTIHYFRIALSEEVKNTNFEVDTIENHYRKIQWAKDPQEGLTGIYLKDLKEFQASENWFHALQMSTSNLTPNQQETVLKILRSARRYKKSR